jgi:hypothetical protein
MCTNALTHRGRLSISISLSFRRSNRHAVSAVIDQADGPTGTGHDDARKGYRYQPVAT